MHLEIQNMSYVQQGSLSRRWAMMYICKEFEVVVDFHIVVPAKETDK